MGVGLVTPTCIKEKLLQKQQEEANGQSRCLESDGASQNASMTRADESPKEVSSSRTRVFRAKNITRIGTWNLRTLFESGKLAQAIREMKKYRLEVLQISEMR